MNINLVLTTRILSNHIHLGHSLINIIYFENFNSTDGGVHALNASAHFDLERPGDKIYDTAYIVNHVNNFFSKNQLSIFVKKCIRVNDDFHARFNAISRTYLYR